MNKKRLIRVALASVVLAGATAGSAALAAPLTYRSVTIDGVKIAYREAGSADKPALLLLHGVPSSSRMYDGLMRKLGDRYHLIAPDYPGFGNSDAPAPDSFTYTFDHLSEVVQKFTDAVGLNRYVLFMQDYGAPVGMRMAVARPYAVQGTIFQNGNVYEEGLGPMWAKRKAFWTDRAAHEQEVRDGQLSLAVTRARHIGSDPDVEAYDPDLWMDEHACLNRPGQAAIQADLIYDYQTNIASYPAWQKWLGAYRLPVLVIWGKHDLAFTVDGAQAFKRDVPQARVAILDAGHFAMDTRLEEVVELTNQYMQANHAVFSAGVQPANYGMSSGLTATTTRKLP
ncbi:alpha/beta fold hydrolase [Undibacterium sp. TJN25]|uniref:alpha/beta fold hydrolase n=1 Tax=Undibacterium sp. TJN25 TaxID=3413056 RepID=UPI003BEF5511